MRAFAMTILLSGLVVGGCHKQDPQTNQQTMSVDEGMPNEVAANAEMETLPADESSTTPSNQLQNGFDSSDVNGTNTVNSQ